MRLKTCPQCGSTDIKPDRIPGLVGIGYACKTCGYAGDVIVEQDVDRRFKK